MIKGILFDKDGTLIEFNQFWHTSISNIFCELQNNYRLSIETMKELKVKSGYKKEGFEKESIIQYRATSEIINIWMKVIKNNQSLDEIEVNDKILLELFEKQSLNQDIAALEGVEEVLYYLKEKGYILGVATADTKIPTCTSLERIGILEYFDYIGCDEVGLLPKPAPDLAIRFCKNHNLNKEEVVVIGDSVTDMVFALNSGTKFIGIKTEYNNHEIFLKNKKEVVEKIKDIIPLIEL